jgi:ribose 5-phosphate isomerase RpiB
MERPSINALKLIKIAQALIGHPLAGEPTNRFFVLWFNETGRYQRRLSKASKLQNKETL